jgi:hypothetical protein
VLAKYRATTRAVLFAIVPVVHDGIRANHTVATVTPQVGGTHDRRLSDT